MNARWTVSACWAIVCLFALTACAPSEAAIQAAIQATADAMPTATPEPTETPTPRPTDTPEPTATPEPMPTPKPLSTLSPKVIRYGARCIDEITNNSYIFLEEEVDWLWLAPTSNVTAVVHVIDTTYILEMSAEYRDDDWLFVDELIFNLDGEVVRLTPTSEFRDVLSNGRIMEIVGFAFTLNNLGPIFELVNADEIKVRYSGSRGIHDMDLTDYELATIQYAYSVYLRLMEGTISPTDFRELCPY